MNNEQHKKEEESEYEKGATSRPTIGHVAFKMPSSSTMKI